MEERTSPPYEAIVVGVDNVKVQVFDPVEMPYV
jgi:hypothetical protein